MPYKNIGWFESRPSDAKPPAALIEALRSAVTAFPKADFAGTGKVTITSDVFLWQHHTAWWEVQRNINGRAAENTIRLAAIRASSRDPAAPSLTVEDIEWAWAIVHQSILLISEGVSRQMSAPSAEALRKAIVEALRAAALMTAAIK